MMNSQDYFNWLSRFEPKYGTDECFTPPAVYDVVLDYVDKHIISLDGFNVVRPFYPNGDYQKEAENYDDNTIVIDNPPFSMSSKIYDFYLSKGIKFFLFTPALTVLSGIRDRNCSAIIAPANITYTNGAIVQTSFATNLLGEVRAMTAPQLYKALNDLDEKDCRSLPRYSYPKNIAMANELQKLCKSGVEFSVGFNESIFISQLDSQKPHKKKLFGGGLLISDEKAKELQTTENFVWQLSEREKAIVEQLGAKK